MYFLFDFKIKICLQTSETFVLLCEIRILFNGRLFNMYTMPYALCTLCPSVEFGAAWTIWGRNSILEILFITLHLLHLLKWAALFTTAEEKHVFDLSRVKVYSSQPLFL